MQQPEVIPHLFRTEYRKIVSVLCRHFGFAQMETAEDIASDTFLDAAQTWPLKGLPPNPTGWLYNVAKNKAKNHLQRHTVFTKKIVPGLKQDNSEPGEEEIDLSIQNINDSQLQMLFAICHPAIPSEAQVGLALRILCGFGIEEIADAFLTNKDTINKRLFRAKEKLREQQVPIEMPAPSALDARLDAVLTTIYLLFNEGYYSVSAAQTIRKELCVEAMRLCTMLTDNASTNKPRVNALLALLCFHASRVESRQGDNGELILYEDQDTSRWNQELIGMGAYYFNQSAAGSHLSRYHLEAGIAYWNTRREDSKEKWESILQLYNRLLQLEYSPIAALNRTYALARANGKEEAVREAEKLQLRNNQFYFVLLGELYAGLDDTKARDNLKQALELAKTVTDKNLIQQKLERLK